MKRRIRRNYKIKNFTELKTAIRKEWNLVNNDILMNCFDGMPRRLEMSIEIEG